MQNHDEESMFIYLDGDDVGSQLELFLLDGKLNEAVRFSELVTEAMLELKDKFVKSENFNILIFGGDDLLGEFSDGALSTSLINQYRMDFELKCGLTISAGAGQFVEDALANLRRAKLSGKNRLVGEF